MNVCDFVNIAKRISIKADDTDLTLEKFLSEHRDT